MFASKWMTMRPKVLPIGVDIGYGRIKMVQLAQADNHLRVVSVERAPFNVSSDASAYEKRDAAIQIIRQLLSCGSFKGRKAVSALSSQELQITSLRLAETETLQVDRLLRREAARRFGLDEAKASINYMLAGNVRQGDEAKNEYIVFAADEETIKGHISLLESAGLQPTGIDAAPCALFRSFERTMRREEDKLRTIIFVDIGHRDTTAVFGRGGEICFVKQIPFGVACFNEEAASKLGLSVADVASLRFQRQQEDSIDASTQRSVVDALTAAAEPLAKELSLCLRYHTVTFRGKRVERAVIAGGGAYEKTLLDVLRHHLSVEIEVGEPLRGFDLSHVKLGENDENSSSDLALAVGLSLKGGCVPTDSTRERAIQPEPALEGELR